jgi:hypothetical protein
MLFKALKSWFKDETVKVNKTKLVYEDIVHKTKKELEEIGRGLGVELDRRLTKDKLLKQLNKLL